MHSLLIGLVLVLVLPFASTDSTLYEIPGETKYEWEMLQKGTIRYMDRLKLLHRYEVRVQNQGLPVERYQWPMYTEDDKVYSCSVPFLQPQKEEKDTTPEDTSLEVLPFLKSLKDTCIYRWEGWWTYEFCFGKHVRQFHQEQDGTIPAQFYLGHDKGLTSGAPGPEYYSEEYEAGSVCDLTGKERTCEIRFYCDPNADVSVFSSFKEPSSCNYVIRIDTPLLCKHPKYVSKLEEETEKILCFETPIPTEQEIQEEEQKQKKQKNLKQQHASQKTPEQQQQEAQQATQQVTQQTTQQQTTQQKAQVQQQEAQQGTQQATQQKVVQQKAAQQQAAQQASQQQTVQQQAAQAQTQPHTKQQQQQKQQKKPSTPTKKITPSVKVQAQQEQLGEPVDEGSGSGKSLFNFQIKHPTKPANTDPVNLMDPAAPLDPVTDVQGHEEHGFVELIHGFDLNQLGAVEEVLKQVLSDMDVDVDILEQTLQNLRINTRAEEEEEHTDDEQKDKL